MVQAQLGAFWCLEKWCWSNWCHMLWLTEPQPSEMVRCPALKGLLTRIPYDQHKEKVIVCVLWHCWNPMQEMNFSALDRLWILCDVFLSQECKKTALFILLSDAVCSLNRWKQLDFNISGIEETEQHLENFSGQIQNTKRLFMQTFSDIKSGDLWRYLSTSVSDYVKAAQTAAGIKIYTEDYKKVLSDIERTEWAL